MSKLNDFSRFSITEPIIIDGQETYGKWKLFNFLRVRPLESQIGVYQVTSALEGRPDSISEAVYGTPLLFWVLIAFNNARDVLNWPKAGDLIEFPLDSVVLPQLL